jgi:4-carboxymuconolactone decarboxylase
MARLPLVPETEIPRAIQSVYQRVVNGATELPSGFRALFASPGVASQLVGLNDLSSQTGLEPWIRLTVALTVFHERDDQVLWSSFEPVAREAGVRDAVIDAIAAGTAPKGLLPKEGIWAQFAMEVLRNQVRDSTWQAVTHLSGEIGAVNVAFMACYYEMLARLNQALDLGSD